MITDLAVQTSANFEKITTIAYANVDELSAAVALEIASLIRENDKIGKPTVLGLATGVTPKKVYKSLIQMHKQDGLSFENVVTFNLDEYFGISSASIQSYKRFMDETLFDHIDIKKSNCHIPDGLTAIEELKEHCTNYENKIRSVGGIDLQLLGIGRNGHIGFNEPGSHINSITRLITLDHTTRADAAYDFGGLIHVPRKAITMGVSTILKSKRIILMAWGERKADIIQQAVEGPASEYLPASYLQGHKDVCFFLDETAASELTRKRTPWLTEEVVWTNALIKKAVIFLSLKLEKSILKLTNYDYNKNGLSDLLALYGQAYDINIDMFNQLQHTITGWPGGKPNADDTFRPERAEPNKKRVLIFSPHPDDDIISMGGTFQRLVDHGHEVHVVYQTSGNIAVADDEGFRFIEFLKDYNSTFGNVNGPVEKMYADIASFIDQKQVGENDIESLRLVKGLIRKSEAKNTCRFVGVPESRVHFLDLPFYETGLVEKNPIGEVDINLISKIIEQIKPHQIYAAGDLADPHGTHKVCLEGIFSAVQRLKEEDYMKDCWVWLYKGAWAEWDIDLIEMAVPMSPDQVLKKRNGIFKHQSQKDGVVYQGADSREFWQRAEDRNRATAVLYDKLGLAEYSAMEAFVRWHF